MLMRTSRSADPLFSAPRKKRAAPFVTLSLFLLLLISLAVYTMVLNIHVTADSLYVTVPNLPGRLENFGILVISDLDGLSFGANQEYLMNAVSALRFDAVCVTGDFTDGRGSPRALIRVLEQLPEDTPVFFIPGDEDPPPIVTSASSGESPLADYILRLEEAGAVYLDTPQSITVGSSTVWFSPAGVFSLDPDSAARAAQSRIDELLAEEPGEQRDAYLRAAQYQLDRAERIRASQKVMLPSDLQIALTHVPLSESSLREMHDLYAQTDSVYVGGISLVLAGHYCAGQWRLPGGGAIWVPEQFPLRKTGFFPDDTGLYGLQTVFGIPQVISAGLGTSDTYHPLMAFRLFNQPKVTLVRLTSRLKQ